MAIKEYQRLEKIANWLKSPSKTHSSMLALIVDAIERVGQGRDEPMIQPWLNKPLFGQSVASATVPKMPSPPYRASEGPPWLRRANRRAGYLGRGYSGSQVQPDVPTVQGELEALFHLNWAKRAHIQ